MKTELKLFVTVSIVSMYLALVCILCGACKTSKESRSFSDAAYAYSTNAVATLRRDLVPYVPAPYNGLLEGALAVSTGLLGLWGAKLHKNVTALNGAAKKATDGLGLAKS